MDLQDLDGVDYRAVRLLVHVVAWGENRELAERAVMKAAVGPARAGWNFADVEMIHDRPCPFDPADPDPNTLADDAGDGWAYQVFKADYTG